MPSVPSADHPWRLRDRQKGRPEIGLAFRNWYAGGCRGRRPEIRVEKDAEGRRRLVLAWLLPFSEAERVLFLASKPKVGKWGPRGTPRRSTR